MLESKCCKANKLQNCNSRSSCLQEQGKESTTFENASGKNVKEVFVEKTKTTDNIETASLSHGIKQGNSNTNIRSRVTEMGDSINTNNRGQKPKKMLLFWETV